MKSVLSHIAMLSMLMLITATFQAQTVSTLLTDPGRSFESIFWLPNGKIYSVDYFNGRVYEIFTDGSVETRLTGFANLVGGGFDLENNFYVSNINTGEILLLNDDGTSTVISSGYSQPISILQDIVNPDLFYVSEYETSEVSTFVRSTGVRSDWINDGGIFFPDGLIYDWNGDILVANFENHRIHRVDLAGNISLFANLGVTGDMGYITIVDEFLYVPSVASRRLYRVGMDGNFTVIAGTGSTGFADGPGAEATFSGPNGICSNPAGDTLLVTDGSRIRIITHFDALLNSTNQSDLGEMITLWPNPSDQLLQLMLSAPLQSVLTVQIMDIQGRSVASEGSIQPGENLLKIDVSHLAAGTYSLQLGTELGLYGSKTFIKK